MAGRLVELVRRVAAREPVRRVAAREPVRRVAAREPVRRVAAREPVRRVAGVRQGLRRAMLQLWPSLPRPPAVCRLPTL